MAINTCGEKTEKDLKEIKKQKEESDKKLLTTEIIIGVASIAACLAVMIIVSLFDVRFAVRCSVIVLLSVYLFTVLLSLLRIEQLAGYYECKECNYKYVSKYSSILWALHINRTRYMRCPKCKKKSWQQKVITK